MKHYALVFRATRALTPGELKQRAFDIQAWVKQVSQQGIELDPRNFGDTAATLVMEAGTVISRSALPDPSVTTIVFFAAPDSDRALSVARIHPGLKYGVTVEVREW